MFIISNGDSELGSCKWGWLPKMESSRVLSCRELIKEKRATLGIICSHLKVITDILYCHGKDWRHNVKWKKKTGHEYWVKLVCIWTQTKTNLGKNLTPNARLGCYGYGWPFSLFPKLCVLICICVCMYIIISILKIYVIYKYVYIQIYISFLMKKVFKHLEKIGDIYQQSRWKRKGFYTLKKDLEFGIYWGLNFKIYQKMSEFRTLHCRYLCFTGVTRNFLFSVEILDINHGFVFLGLNDIPLWSFLHTVKRYFLVQSSG